MTGTKAIALLISVALLTGAAPQDVDEYALREAAAPELAEFQGGFHVAVLVLIGLVLGGLLASSLSECELCGAARVEELPPWEGPPPGRLPIP